MTTERIARMNNREKASIYILCLILLLALGFILLAIPSNAGATYIGRGSSYAITGAGYCTWYGVPAIERALSYPDKKFCIPRQAYNAAGGVRFSFGGRFFVDGIRIHSRQQAPTYVKVDFYQGRKLVAADFAIIRASEFVTTTFVGSFTQAFDNVKITIPKDNIIYLDAVYAFWEAPVPTPVRPPYLAPVRPIPPINFNLNEERK
jgi:hypothetical protein